MLRIERFPPRLARPVAGASVLGLVFLVACGGRAIGAGNQDGGAGTSDGSSFMEPDGAVCVDIDLSSYDLSCTTSADCLNITAGTLCATNCLCGGSSINKSGETRYEAEIAQLTTRGPVCSCPASGQPVCRHGTCALCGGILGSPACEDGGTSSSDGGVDAEAGSCVDINLADYDQSCNTPSDCTLIPSGEVCSGTCDCGASPINVSGEAKYQAAVSGIVFENCPCISAGPLGCVGGKCTVCSGPTACPDGG